jgi:NitT/TauT family transport system permease protein
MTTKSISRLPVAAVQPARSPSRIRRRLARAGYGVIGIALLIGAWAYAAAYMFEPIVLPAPTAVAERMWEMLEDGLVISNFAATLWKTLLGWWGALLVGIPIGALMGRFRYASAFFHDLMYILANTPLVLFAVMAIVVFGVSNTGPAVVVASHVLPIVALNVAAGVRSADAGLLGMSQAFGRSRGQVARRVVLPAVTPFLMSGARVSFAGSWKLAALTETFVGSSGVGYQIRRSFQVFSVLDAMAWMMFFVILIIALERLVLKPLEKRLFAWRDPSGRSEA